MRHSPARQRWSDVRNTEGVDTNRVSVTKRMGIVKSSWGRRVLPWSCSAGRDS